MNMIPKPLSLWRPPEPEFEPGDCTVGRDNKCLYTLRVDYEGAPGMWNEIQEWCCLYCGEPTPNGTEPPDSYKHPDYR